MMLLSIAGSLQLVLGGLALRGLCSGPGGSLPVRDVEVQGSQLPH